MYLLMVTVLLNKAKFCKTNVLIEFLWTYWVERYVVQIELPKKQKESILGRSNKDAIRATTGVFFRYYFVVTSKRALA